MYVAKTIHANAQDHIRVLNPLPIGELWCTARAVTALVRILEFCALHQEELYVYPVEIEETGEIWWEATLDYDITGEPCKDPYEALISLADRLLPDAKDVRYALTREQQGKPLSHDKHGQ